MVNYIALFALVHDLHRVCFQIGVHVSGLTNTFTMRFVDELTKYFTIGPLAELTMGADVTEEKDETSEAGAPGASGDVAKKIDPEKVCNTCFIVHFLHV